MHHGWPQWALGNARIRPRKQLTARLVTAVVVALLIATCKASVVVLIFMHVKYTSEKMTRVILIAAVFWLLLLLVLSLTDYSSRFAG